MSETLAEKKRRMKHADKMERQREYYERRAKDLEIHGTFWQRARCFWSWPWGHVRTRNQSGSVYVCAACGFEVGSNPSGGY